MFLMILNTGLITAVMSFLLLGQGSQGQHGSIYMVFKANAHAAPGVVQIFFVLWNLLQPVQSNLRIFNRRGIISNYEIREQM